MTRTDREPSAAPPCPICRKPARPDFKPFCSARCADVDLGRWLGERYVIPGPEPDDPERAERGSDAGPR